MFDQPVRVACGQCGCMTATELCSTCVIHFCRWHHGPLVSIHSGHDCAAFSLEFFQEAAQIRDNQIAPKAESPSLGLLKRHRQNYQVTSRRFPLTVTIKTDPTNA